MKCLKNMIRCSLSAPAGQRGSGRSRRFFHVTSFLKVPRSLADQAILPARLLESHFSFLDSQIEPALDRLLSNE